MKITFLATGTTADEYLLEGIAQYEKRLKHYIPYICRIIAGSKSSRMTAEADQRHQEGVMILKAIDQEDHVILLDEKGKSFSSAEFAAYLQKLMNAGIKNCVFVSGGPFGFDQRMYDRANDILALSRMTFTHQMVRLIFTEQLYRAMTILRNEPYHH